MWYQADEQPPDQAGTLPAADFIIAVFDSSVQYDIHHSPGSLSAFYLEIISLL